MEAIPPARIMVLFVGGLLNSFNAAEDEENLRIHSLPIFLRAPDEREILGGIVNTIRNTPENTGNHLSSAITG